MATAQDLGKKLKVLIVDDDQATRQLMEKFLHGINCEIHLASQGLEALAKHKSIGFDIVLLDIEMPLLDGYVTARCLRKLEAGEKVARSFVVAVTGKASDREREKAYVSGCDMLLAKPIKREQLTNIFENFESLKVALRPRVL